MDLSGKVAIVTGGAQGIGKAISTTLLKIGMKISKLETYVLLLICDVNESSAKLFLEEIPSNLKSNVIYQKCDVSSFEDIQVAFKKAKSTYGRIDVVVNNAGIMNESQWKKTIDINFIGVIHGINLAFEYMGINNGGSGGFIINTSSVAGLNAFNLAPIYSATKHAVVGLTKSFGTQYYFEKTGVTVNAVCPGPIDTPLFHAFPGLTVNKELCTEIASKQTPVSPDEVAKAVLQLIKDGKNGALIRVDGYEGIRYEKEPTLPEYLK